jgi:hypothetical protein
VHRVGSHLVGGIAACEVICCVRLGRHAQGESHNDAVALVKTADADAGRAAEALLEALAASTPPT